METKLCRKCGHIKSINAFSIDRKMNDGRSCYCRDCRNRLVHTRKMIRLKAIALGRNPLLVEFSDTQLIEEVLMRLKTKL